MEGKYIFCGWTLGLVILGLIVFALPYYPWGFLRDDYGFLSYAATHMDNWLHFFKAHNVVDFVNSGEISSETLSWNGSFYRPMQFVHFALEYLFFGTHAYMYLIFIVLLHGVLVSLLFYIGQQFFSKPYSFIAAILVLMHPLHHLWMGVFTIQIYIIDALYFFAITWLLKNFIDTRKAVFYLGSCWLFFVALLAKETLIVYPGWVFIAATWYFYEMNLTLLRAIKQAALLMLGYVGVAFFYIGFRYAIFAEASTKQAGVLGFISWNAFFTRQSERFFDLVTYVCNYLYVGVIPGGNRFLKFGLLVLIAGLIVYPFLRRRRSLLLLFLVLSMLAVTWPAWLLYYHTRYAYSGLIFLYFIILFCIDFYVDRFEFLSKIGGQIILVVSLVLLVSRASAIQVKKNAVLSRVTSSVRKIASTVVEENKPVVFVFLPHQWFASGVCQMMQLFYPAQNFRVREVGLIHIEGDDEYGEMRRHDANVFIKDNFLRINVAGYEPFTPNPGIWNNKKIEISDEELVICWDYQKNTFKRLQQV